MHGVIGKIVAQPGHRQDILTVLGRGRQHLPGCLSYIIAKDVDSPDVIWITEVWDSEAYWMAVRDDPALEAASRIARPRYGASAGPGSSRTTGGRARGARRHMSAAQDHPSAMVARPPGLALSA